MTSLDASNGLAAQAVALLTAAAPYLLKGAGKGAAKALGADAWKQAKELYRRVRERFQKDRNAKAVQSLDLFLSDTDTFDSALGKLLLATLQQHPEWAEEIRALLADEPSVQEIILRNQSRVERITLSLSGSGTQRYESDNSTGTDIRIEKK